MYESSKDTTPVADKAGPGTLLAPTSDGNHYSAGIGKVAVEAVFGLGAATLFLILLFIGAFALFFQRVAELTSLLSGLGELKFRRT